MNGRQISIATLLLVLLNIFVDLFFQDDKVLERIGTLINKILEWGDTLYANKVIQNVIGYAITMIVIFLLNKAMRWLLFDQSSTNTNAEKNKKINGVISIIITALMSLAKIILTINTVEADCLGNILLGMALFSIIFSMAIWCYSIKNYDLVNGANSIPHFLVDIKKNKLGRITLIIMVIMIALKLLWGCYRELGINFIE